MFARKRGVTRDLTHIFLGAARSLRSRHAMSLAICAATRRRAGKRRPRLGGGPCTGLGWVGFDAVNCVCPTEAYVRVAVGLDALGAVPVRGTRYGGGEETLAVAIKVDQ